MNQKGNTALAIMLAVAMVALGVYFLGQDQKLRKKVVPTQPAPTIPVAPAENSPTTTPVPSPTPLVSPTIPPDPNIGSFMSPELNISFQYLIHQGSETMTTTSVGNTVYVHVAQYPYTQGQYVEVFKKSPGDSLVNAIKKQFLGGYAAENCLVGPTTNPVPNKLIPASYQLAHISVPVTETDDLSTIEAKADKCPRPYTRTNGIAYFLADPARPSTFVFFSIGQYPIEAPHGNLWQNTIKFLK